MSTETTPTTVIDTNLFIAWTAAIKILQNEIEGRNGFDELYKKMDDKDRNEFINSIVTTIKGTLDFYES